MAIESKEMCICVTAVTYNIKSEGQRDMNTATPTSNCGVKLNTQPYRLDRHSSAAIWITEEFSDFKCITFSTS